MTEINPGFSMVVDKAVWDQSSNQLACIKPIGPEFWLCRQHKSGRWVTARKALPEDARSIARAVLDGSYLDAPGNGMDPPIEDVDGFMAAVMERKFPRFGNN